MIKKTIAYKELLSRNSPFLQNIDKVYDHAEKVLPKINRVFSNYTGHGIDHAIRVIEYAMQLCDDITQLSDLEITALVYVALFHDIGMVASEREISNIKVDKDDFSSKKYSLIYKKYQDENIALQECIRPVHGKRSARYIEKMNSDYFVLPSYTAISFQNDIAKICEAHNENFEWLSTELESDQRKGLWSLNSQYIAMLLRIADYLDIDEERAPLYLYKYLSPEGYGDMEWKQHFIIENKEKILVDKQTGKKNIEFYGESTDPAIHRKLLNYLDGVNQELLTSVRYSETFIESRYLLSINTHVYNKIRTKGFSYSDFKLSLDYRSVTNLLMGENIYGAKIYGLREIIQNSIDACMLMKEKSIAMDEFKYTPYSPSIKIILDYDKQRVIILDNGCGMSVAILKNYFLNVGVSYYSSNEYMFEGNRYVPIGNYGIGFLACFMLSDKVEVSTKYVGETNLNRIELEKSSEFICLTFEDTTRAQGTELTLDLVQFMDVFAGKPDQIEKFISKNFLACEISIEIIECRYGQNNSKKIKLDTMTKDLKNPIMLDDYFHNVNVAAIFQHQLVYLQYFSDIQAKYSLVYSCEKQTLLDESKLKQGILLKDYLSNGELKYLSLPIIDSKDEVTFERAFEVLDDFEESLDKVSYQTVNILNSYQHNYNYSEILEDDDDIILESCTLGELKKVLEHPFNSLTYTFLKEKEVVTSNCEKILPYVRDMKCGGKYSFIKTDKVYIKNVLVGEASVIIPFLVEGIEISDLVVNVLSKEITPNISRNNLNVTQSMELSYAIGKAIHLWIYDNIELTDDERSLLEIFISSYYSKKSALLNEHALDKPHCGIH